MYNENKILLYHEKNPEWKSNKQTGKDIVDHKSIQVHKERLNMGHYYTISITLEYVWIYYVIYTTFYSRIRLLDNYNKILDTKIKNKLFHLNIKTSFKFCNLTVHRYHNIKIGKII